MGRKVTQILREFVLPVPARLYSFLVQGGQSFTLPAQHLWDIMAGPASGYSPAQPLTCDLAFSFAPLLV